ncbi:MAG: type II toxin-antitoxin system Phd/YefM family antitoxin [Clostridia bacterium]|nr:type II toxin-antitoxin system Phd/YefM family antitoxin [Clostridia bacterium]
MNTSIGVKALTAKPSSLIRSDYNAFSTMCHAGKEPILITRNGESDLVVMSHETYNDLIDRLRLTAELIEADRELYSDVSTIPAETVFSELREMLHEQAQD